MSLATLPVVDLSVVDVGVVDLAEEPEEGGLGPHDVPRRVPLDAAQELGEVGRAAKHLTATRRSVLCVKAYWRIPMLLIVCAETLPFLLSMYEA